MTSETRNKHFFKPSIIDVESSGLGPESYPIEIGVALSSGEQYCSLILPAPSWDTWDRHSELIHGISLEEVMTSGKPIGDVTRELNRLLENRTVYTDGWVVDQRWISQLYYEASIPKQFTVSSLESILSEGQMNIWHESKNHVMRELGLKRHRASADALIIQETYTRTRKLAG